MVGAGSSYGSLRSLHKSIHAQNLNKSLNEIEERFKLWLVEHVLATLF